MGKKKTTGRPAGVTDEEWALVESLRKKRAERDRDIPNTQAMRNAYEHIGVPLFVFDPETTADRSEGAAVQIRDRFAQSAGGEILARDWHTSDCEGRPAYWVNSGGRILLVHEPDASWEMPTR